MIKWIQGYETGSKQGAIKAAIRLGLGMDAKPEPVALKLRRQLEQIESEHKAIKKTVYGSILQMERKYQHAMKTRGLPITEVSPIVLEIRAENIRNAPW